MILKSDHDTWLESAAEEGPQDDYHHGSEGCPYAHLHVPPDDLPTAEDDPAWALLAPCQHPCFGYVYPRREEAPREQLATVGAVVEDDIGW